MLQFMHEVQFILFILDWLRQRIISLPQSSLAMTYPLRQREVISCKHDSEGEKIKGLKPKQLSAKLEFEGEMEL